MGGRSILQQMIGRQADEGRLLRRQVRGRCARRSGVAVYVLAVTAVVLPACAGADRAATSLEAPPEEWRLLDTVRIGSVDGPDALTRVGALVALPGGGAWFTQPMEQIVRVVDVDGRLVRSVGRRGQGPGEFTAMGPLGLWRGSPDTIWVMDWMPRRLSLFTADGAFVRTVPMPDVSWAGHWRVDQPDVVGPDGVPLALARYAPGVDNWEDGFPILRFTLPEGEVLGEVARVERTAAVQIRWRGDVVATGAHPMPDAPIVAYSPDGRFVAIVDRSTDRRGAGPEVRIAVLEADGDTAWAKPIAYVPEPIPAAEADSIWGERIASFQRFAQVEGRLTADDARQAYRASLPVPSHRPPVESVAMSSDGRLLLVWSAAPGRPRQAWVIAPGGELVALVEVPAGQQVLAFEGHHVWAVEYDEMGVPVVVRYGVGR